MQLTVLIRTLVTCAPLEVEPPLVAPAGAVPPELALLDAGEPPASTQSSAPATAARMRLRCL